MLIGLGTNYVYVPAADGSGDIEFEIEVAIKGSSRSLAFQVAVESGELDVTAIAFGDALDHALFNDLIGQLREELPLSIGHEIIEILKAEFDDYAAYVDKLNFFAP